MRAPKLSRHRGVSKRIVDDKLVVLYRPSPRRSVDYRYALPGENPSGRCPFLSKGYFVRTCRR